MWATQYLDNHNDMVDAWICFGLFFGLLFIFGGLLCWFENRKRDR